MSALYCEGKWNCTLWAATGAALLGVLAALLLITAVVTLTPAFLWAVFGIAIGLLAVTLAAAWQQRLLAGSCHGALGALLAGIGATAVLAVVLLGIPFAATSFLGAVLTGALVAAFFLAVFAGLCLVKCLAGRK